MLHAEHAYCFANVPESVGRARSAVKEKMASWDCDGDLIETAITLTSELVTNCVIHAADSPAFIAVCFFEDEYLTIAVMDFGAAMPQIREPDPDSVAGRGLLLVEAMSDHWGYEPFSGGKLVFADIKLPDFAVSDIFAGSGVRTGVC